MATTDELRLKILDRPQGIPGEVVGTGDGTRDRFKLRNVPVMADSVSLVVGGIAKTEEVDYSLDYVTGVIVLNVAPDEGDLITADYEFAAFTDGELQTILDSSGGNLSLAAGQALTSLIADRSRLVTWTRGDSRVDYDRLRRDISDVARRFYSQGACESGGKTDEIAWEEVE